MDHGDIIGLIVPLLGGCSKETLKLCLFIYFIYFFIRQQFVLLLAT